MINLESIKAKHHSRRTELEALYIRLDSWEKAIPDKTFGQDIIDKAISGIKQRISVLEQCQDD